MKRISSVLALCVIGFTLCGRAAGADQALKSFHARGVIRALPDTKTVVIQHEAIPGLMPSMTMTFTTRAPQELTGLKPGDTVTFDVKATEEESWIENVQRSLTSPTTTPPSASTGSFTSLAHIAKAKPGDLIPDGELLDEDGRTIRLSDFRGRVLAFTFIFTRCPLPDFCPRMSRSFEQARELLLHNNSGPTNWQFLSISFDTDFDQPAVMARYAQNYRHGSADHWLFATARPSMLDALVPQLDFRFSREGGSLIHNLRTVVLDPQGRLYRQFDGNRWTPAELAQAVEEAERKATADR